MTSWSSRMAAAVLAHEARANDANSASSSVEVSRMGDIGTIGTIWHGFTESSGPACNRPIGAIGSVSRGRSTLPGNGGRVGRAD